MISKCFGDIVLPMMTMMAIIKFGMYAYLKFLNEITVNMINDNSNMIASKKNFGEPSGIPKAPTTQIAARIETRYF